MEKRMKMIAFAVFIAVLIVLGYIIYSNAARNNNERTLEEKLVAEVNYLETKIINMANRINNITVQNYKVTTTEIESQSGTGESSSNSAESGQDTQSQGNGGSNSSQGNSSNSGESSSSNTTSGESDADSEKQKEYNMERVKEISKSKDKEINWDDIQKEIEEIYTVMPTVTLDLYQTSINQEDILKFNNYLDELAIATKNEDEQNTLDKLCDMYSAIAKFAENVSQDELYKTTIKTKDSSLKGYRNVNNEKWDDASNDLQNAVDGFSFLLTNTNVNYGKQVNINKIYVILNEMKNAIGKKEKDVFLIKYKNLLEETNSI